MEGVKNRKNQVGSLRVKIDMVGIQEDSTSVHIEGTWVEHVHDGGMGLLVFNNLVAPLELKIGYKLVCFI